MNKYFVVVSDHQGDMFVEEFDDIEAAEAAIQAAEDEDNNRAVLIRCEGIHIDNQPTFKIEYHT